MRVLFLMGHRGYARNFASTIEQLSDRGHEVVIALDRKSDGPRDALTELLAGDARISVVGVAPPSPATRRWTALARGLRFVIDQLHQLEVAPPGGKTAERAASYLAGPVRPVLRLLAAIGTRRRRMVVATLQAVSRRLRPAPADVAFVASQRPDVVLVTPLVEFGSRQPDKLRAASRLGIPTALLVHSWDNLTTKGRIHGDPDRVIVWNDAQKAEAVSLHGVSPERVVVTGAASWDQWFARQAGSRAELCAGIGADPAGPLLTYLCSSAFVAPDEGTAILEWIDAVRAADDDRVRAAGIIVRPHPGNPLGATAQTIDSRAGVAVFPRQSAHFSRGVYFETLAHSDAVVGVNTSALLEAAIVGRPAYTVLSAQFEPTQRRARHFQHLSDPDGGLLHVAEDLDEHVRQLSAALQDPRSAAARSRGFVRRFIRPRGLELAATPLVVDAIEALALPDRRQSAGTLPPMADSESNVVA